MNAAQIVEAVLFASDAPLKAEEIARADESLDEDRVEEAIQYLLAEYAESERAFTIRELAEGYQILTRSEFAPYLERFDTVPRPSRLSGPALETLAIIAYRQPIGRIEVEYIRGVGSSGVIRTLQDRGLVEVVGRGEGLGRPLLYGTTALFLEHFGFSSLNDLPRPEELPVVLRDRPPLGIDDADDPDQGTLFQEGGEGGAEDGETDEGSEAPTAETGEEGPEASEEAPEASEEAPEAGEEAVGAGDEDPEGGRGADPEAADGADDEEEETEPHPPTAS